MLSSWQGQFVIVPFVTPVAANRSFSLQSDLINRLAASCQEGGGRSTLFPSLTLAGKKNS